jgi:hypothetical protein
MALENPSLGRPHFTTRFSPFCPDQYIAQLTFGSKYFLSSTTHPTKELACQDAAQVALEELERMENARNKSRYARPPEPRQRLEREERVYNRQEKRTKREEEYE